MSWFCVKHNYTIVIDYNFGFSHLINVTDIDGGKGNVFQRRHRRVDRCHRRGLGKLLDVTDDDEDGEAADDDEEDDPDGPPDIANISIEVRPAMQTELYHNGSFK